MTGDEMVAVSKDHTVVIDHGTVRRPRRRRRRLLHHARAR
jgi:hypothetical protein